MQLGNFFILAGLPVLISAQKVVVTCSFAIGAVNGDTCESFGKTWALDLATFVSLNPSAKCPDLVAGQDYCVVGTVATVTVTSEPTVQPTSSSTKTTTTATTTTQPGNGITTPSPVQPGIALNCNKFYFINKNDNCADIVVRNGISLSDFLTWNPNAGAGCAGLWADTWACVSVIGYVPTTTTTKPTATGNGIQTPLPTQPGMVDGCNKFQFVNTGDTCVDISSRNFIPLSTFLQWNPQAGSTCSGLWSNAYACVGMVAFSLKSRYHGDCTGDAHNVVNLNGSDGMCINTDCAVGSLEIAQAGFCPDGQVQISYWEKAGCQGKWFGYGYASRGQCRQLWTQGWKFKALHLRCMKSQDDCVNQRTCTFDPEPAQNAC